MLLYLLVNSLETWWECFYSGKSDLKPRSPHVSLRGLSLKNSKFLCSPFCNRIGKTEQSICFITFVPESVRAKFTDPIASDGSVWLLPCAGCVVCEKAEGGLQETSAGGQARPGCGMAWRGSPTACGAVVIFRKSALGPWLQFGSCTRYNSEQRQWTVWTFIGFCLWLMLYKPWSFESLRNSIKTKLF